MKHPRWIPTLFVTLLLATGLPSVAGPGRQFDDQSVQVRFGVFFVEGDSDFWDDNESVFTLQASDFDDFIFGMTYSHGFNRFLELDLNADFFDGAVVADYRDFVDASGFPIFHDTRLEMVPLTIGFRLLPFGRAKNGGNKPALFLGAGGGINFWSYQEVGDFIDFSDPANPIVFGAFKDSGEAFVGYVAAGLELPLGRGFNIGLEARYFKSDDNLSGAFAGLGTLDMSGFSTSVSANWRF